jgi:hypothetical protein
VLLRRSQLPPAPLHPTSAQAAAAAEAALSSQRFNQLDVLLSKAQMYTNFLTEQMAVYHKPGEAAGAGTSASDEGEEEAEAEEEGAGSKQKGGKRKKGGKGSAAAAGAASKRQKSSIVAAAAKGAAAAAAAANAASAEGTLAERQKVCRGRGACSAVLRVARVLRCCCAARLP